ncbi:hypothetical protein ACFUMI_19030 [Streptomyces sp. NPDC057273]|uniref:hypothetical protein n=1 Tax=Streptomyces sp. NPDC057273 TaxID=3346080 RepID=UPI0036277EB9
MTWAFVRPPPAFVTVLEAYTTRPGVVLGEGVPADHPVEGALLGRPSQVCGT